MITILICVHSVTDMNDKFLSEALLSLRNQTYKNFKTIIVLDECWDKTKKIVNDAEFDKDTLLVIERNKKEGLAYAKNYGLSFVDTKYVAFLDADDLYEPTKLEKQVEFIKDNEVDFIGTQHSEINIYDRVTRRISPYHKDCHIYVTHEEVVNAIRNGYNVFTHGSMLIKMKALIELGCYKHVLGAEDWDLWQRAVAANKYKFHQLEERLYVWCEGSAVSR